MYAITVLKAPNHPYIGCITKQDMQRDVERLVTFTSVNKTISKWKKEQFVSLCQAITDIGTGNTGIPTLCT